MTTIRAATQKDIESFYGKMPPLTMKGFVVEHAGQIIGIGGIYWNEGKKVLFSEIKSEGKKFKKTMVRVAKRIVAELNPRYALADGRTANSVKLLEHLGFEPVEGVEYDGSPLFEMRR
jgi:hypothetical protein